MGNTARQMQRLGRPLTLSCLPLAVAAGLLGCRKSPSTDADDGAAVATFMAALKSPVDGFDTSQTTNCQTDRLRSLGGDAPVFVDVDVARAYFAGTPAKSRFPLERAESVPAELFAKLDAHKQKKAGEAARYAASVPLWGLYVTEQLDLPSIGMVGDKPKSLAGGKVSIVMNLVERATGATLCTLRVDAESSATVKVTTNAEGRTTGAGADLLDNARRNLERRLQEVGR